MQTSALTWRRLGTLLLDGRLIDPEAQGMRTLREDGDLVAGDLID